MGQVWGGAQESELLTRAQVTCLPLVQRNGLCVPTLPRQRRRNQKIPTVTMRRCRPHVPARPRAASEVVLGVLEATRQAGPSFRRVRRANLPCHGPSQLHVWAFLSPIIFRSNVMEAGRGQNRLPAVQLLCCHRSSTQFDSP